MKRTRGFSLVESVLVIVLIGILSFVLAIYIRESVHAWGFLSGQSSLVATSRATMNRMVRELRQSWQLVSCGRNAVSFMDQEDLLEVTYSQGGFNLWRNLVDLQLANLQQLDGLVFTYLDEHGLETIQINEVKTIRIRITTVAGDNKFVIESAARLRQVF